MCSKRASVACNEKRNELSYMILHNFTNCPIFVDTKQLLHYKVAVK